MYCRSCGARLKEGDVFCLNCGARIVDPKEENAPEQISSTDTDDAVTADSKREHSSFILRSSLGAKIAIVVVIGALIGGGTAGLVKHNQAKHYPPVAKEKTDKKEKKKQKGAETENLKEIKKPAIEELKSYINPEEYSSTRREEMAKAIQAGITAIESSKSEEEVDQALAKAKGQIDQIKIDAQSGNTKKAAKNTLPALPELSLTSGVGGWSDSISIKQDGSFAGANSDYDYDRTYDCHYSGQISDIEKIDDFTYRCKIASISTARPEGTTWTENGVLYEAIAAGFSVGDTCYIYLPGKPISELSDAFLDWGGPNTRTNATLPCYALEIGELGYYADHFF